jgi:hypothetical protein
MTFDGRSNRRRFIGRSLAVVPAVVPCLRYGLRASAADGSFRLTIETEGPARVEVRGLGQQMFQPPNALMDRSFVKQLVVDRKNDFYGGHFTSPGTASLSLPAGKYTVVVEKGMEFERLESAVNLSADAIVRLAPKRWVDMAARGWWSGDLHVHRPPEDAKALLAAEDLNLGVFFTIWNSKNYWRGKDIPARPIEQLDATHIATLMNAEDERGGGAWMMHNLKTPVDMTAAKRWYPQGRAFVDQAIAQGGWFECEKPIWWEAPVMAALERIDSLGVIHNHYNQYGMMANEAWGRPRDQNLFPGITGFSNYSLSLYYRYLNLGLRIPASAGSASGVLPSPPGYNRVYVYAPEGFSVEGFYSSLRAGHNFVTNGPIMTFTVNGKIPSDTIAIQPGRRLQVTVETQAREPIDRVELIANGRVVADSAGTRLEAEIDPENHTWLAARCNLKTQSTIRLAHTSPIYLSGEGQNWDATADRAYFVKWIDDLIADSELDGKRFSNVDEKSAVLAIYRSARQHYLERTKA